MVYQLDGSVSKVHAEMLRLANIEDWEIPKDQNDRQLRDAAYVIPPQASESSSSSDSDSDPEMNIPLAKLARKYRHERDNSDSEDDIPLMELAKRLRVRNQDVPPQNSPKSSEIEDMDFTHELSSGNIIDESSDNMIIDEVKRAKKKPIKNKKREHDYQKDKMQIMKMILERL